MSGTRLFDTGRHDANWHLAHSRPEDFLHYDNPARPFGAQMAFLVERFRRVQALCEAGQDAVDLLRLRNALAFHLVRMSRWWCVEFCPRGVTSIESSSFLTHVHAHIERSLEDDMLYDVFTMQRHMHPGEDGHVLILSREDDPATGLRMLFGIDGQRGFRFAAGSADAAPVWNGRRHPDFAGSWLAAQGVKSLMLDDADALREFQRAEVEHAGARGWHQRHFHVRCERHLAQAYERARTELADTRTAFGRAERDAVVNDLAFRVAWMALHRTMTVAEFLDAAGLADASPRAAIEIKRRARLHARHGIDATRRADVNARLDRLISFLPRPRGAPGRPA